MDSTRPVIDYCTDCGHNAEHHRSAKCWVDAIGEPVTRKRSLIDCPCTELVREDS